MLKAITYRIEVSRLFTHVSCGFEAYIVPPHNKLQRYDHSKSGIKLQKAFLLPSDPIHVSGDV